ncbi:hydroxymethylbilane synthase [uncultured Aquimonas sp.]|uniref:hydroxymethylbilane synthase n=1 Tax=uncultured Aquimonas sp. TaxID=385483 RepID=UPI000868E5D4|nr:hydroxymethylbilane synthase [uncultured Aquimonas sp.]ODU43475.1 MAG: hydroxymethylbilane synthase [Xanthomonadaceae bacterium SCN 69-123]
MTRTLRIATRKSALALWQTEHVADRLRALHPGISVQLVPLSTRGDEVLDRSLAAIGGKGLFLKELEEAMLRGEADLAVHSLKDVPMALEGPFVLPAVLERANPFDAFVSNTHDDVAALPEGARVGTSSLRRRAQLKALRPDLDIVDLRGNVNTRLAKLDAGDYAAIVLACAGLERLGFHARIRATLAPPAVLPAASQGAIAIECRADATDVQALLAPLDHAPTRRCVDAERAMNLALGGSCHAAIAAYCIEQGGALRLRGWVGDARSGEGIAVDLAGPTEAPQTLGTQAADALRARGAVRLLASA